jgi:hypothetical protein
MRRKPEIKTGKPEFSKGEYRGMDISKLVIRPNALTVLRAPSKMGSTLVPYELVFDRRKK